MSKSKILPYSPRCLVLAEWRRPRRLTTRSTISGGISNFCMMCPTVAFTLAIFVVVYLGVFGAGTGYLLRIVAKGPVEGESDHAPAGGAGQMRQPMRPMSGASDLDDETAPRPAATGG